MDSLFACLSGKDSGWPLPAQPTRMKESQQRGNWKLTLGQLNGRFYLFEEKGDLYAIVVVRLHDLKSNFLHILTVYENVSALAPGAMSTHPPRAWMLRSLSDSYLTRSTNATQNGSLRPDPLNVQASKQNESGQVLLMWKEPLEANQEGAGSAAGGQPSGEPAEPGMLTGPLMPV